MQNIIDWLSGKKTYILMILGFVFNLGIAAGWWAVESQVWQLVDLILGFLGLGTIRAAITKATKN
jgi:hypothetical protein